MIGSIAEAILRSTRWPVLTAGPEVRPPTRTAANFHRILYATDFSQAAAHAAVFALSFAESFGAELDVLNVIGNEAVENPERLHEIEKAFYASLDRLVPEEVREFCDPRTFVEAGNARSRILKHSKERSIDLLILGIRKSSHLGMETRRSGAFQLIVDAQCPVLTITG